MWFKYCSGGALLSAFFLSHVCVACQFRSFGQLFLGVGVKTRIYHFQVSTATVALVCHTGPTVPHGPAVGGGFQKGFPVWAFYKKGAQAKCLNHNRGQQVDPLQILNCFLHKTGIDLKTKSLRKRETRSHTKLTKNSKIQATQKTGSQSTANR